MRRDDHLQSVILNPDALEIPCVMVHKHCCILLVPFRPILAYICHDNKSEKMDFLLQWCHHMSVRKHPLFLERDFLSRRTCTGILVDFLRFIGIIWMEPAICNWVKIGNSGWYWNNAVINAAILWMQSPRPECNIVNFGSSQNILLYTKIWGFFITVTCHYNIMFSFQYLRIFEYPESDLSVWMYLTINTN